MADFETTVSKDPNTQTETEVWAFAVTQLYDASRYVEVGNNIQGLFDYFINKYKDGKRHNIICGFHNLKWDGQFIGCYLKANNYKYIYDREGKRIKPHDIGVKEYCTFINDMGAWYSLTVRVNYNLCIEFRDTLKILPMKVAQMKKAFGTEHDKLAIEYDTHEHANEVITEEEKEYIKNDVLVVAEALEIFIANNNLNKFPVTIGGVALSTYKRYFSYKNKQGVSLFNKKKWSALFPDLTKIQLNESSWGSPNVDNYIRKGYRGGWCHAERTSGVQGKSEAQPHYCIKVFDVNSLYPSVMQCKENRYPVGQPRFISDLKGFDGVMNDKSKYYFVRFKCAFKLKDGALPFIQIKNSLHCARNANLTDSYSAITGKLETHELTMPKTTFEMFIKYYTVLDFDFLDCIYFNTATPKELYFEDYVHDLGKIKEQATIDGNKGLRTCVKLLLNNLYGKFSVNPDNLMSIPQTEQTEDYFKTEVIELPDKEPLYIPIGSAITAYARCFTVSCAIANSKYFCYADTDSLHLSCPVDYTPVNCPIHDTKFEHWANEANFTNGVYPRQKTYIEFNQGSKNVEDYDVKACGLQDKGKELFVCAITNNKPSFELNQEQQAFLNKGLKISDFNVGLVIPYKIMPRKIKGGVVLVNSRFSIN